MQLRREVTNGHLLLDVDALGVQANVNPPIRPRKDVEYLWQSVLESNIDWIVSDHACCSAEMKTDPENPDQVFLAKSGFGGTEYLLSGLYAEGRKRGLPEHRMAELVCWNPSRRFGLNRKGDIASGFDADLVLFDPNASFVVRVAESESDQGFTPFEGIELQGKVCTTFLRGHKVWEGGKIVGPARGRFVKRPMS